MPRSYSSSSSSKPILGRAMAILALPLTPISKAKRGLLLLKQRRRGSYAGYKPYRHYSYAYVGEYQFSPSASPLIAYPPGVSAWRRAARSKKRRSSSKARLILASLLCGAAGRDDFDVAAAVLDGLPPPPPPLHGDDDAPAVHWAPAVDEEEEEDDDEGDEEVDGRAERFIERFYQEMRLQRQRSLLRQLL